MYALKILQCSINICCAIVDRPSIDFLVWVKGYLEK